MSLASAVRGASSGRVASVTDVQDYVVSRSLGLLQRADVTVTWPAGNTQSNPVEITTSYVFTPVAPLIPQSARTLTSTTRMIISR